MANSALIDDLLKQFADNPRRVFARLANEYRKAGELETAIEICRAHVPLQPTYISGYIVLGQALFESGQLDEARATFETALGLDPENLIALRQLGDIARAVGDLENARAWYHRLLEVDPQNDEVARQLAEMESPLFEPPPPPHPAPAPEPISWSDINPESASSAVPAETTPPEMAPLDLVPPVEMVGAPAADAAASPAAPARAEERAAASTDAPLPDIGALDFDSPPLDGAAPAGARAELPSIDMDSGSGWFDAPPPARPAAAGPPAAESPATRAQAAAAPTRAAEPATPAAELEPAARASLAEEPRVAELEAGAAEPAPEAPPVRQRELPYDPTVGRMLDLSVPVAAEPPMPPAAFVTETMAELYLQQGFHDEALDIYRQLLAQRPDDAGLRERVARLESGARTTVSQAEIPDEVIAAASGRGSRSSVTARAFFAGFASPRRRPANGAAPAARVEAAMSTQAPAPLEATAPVEAPTIEPTPTPAVAWSLPMLPSEPRADVASDDASAASAPGTVAAPDASAPAAPGSTAHVESPVAPFGGRDDVGELFAGAPVGSADERAAATLATAFSGEFAKGADALGGQPARKAPTELSLDDVFRGERTPAEPATPAPNVSFDEFYAPRDGAAASDGAAQPDAPHTPPRPENGGDGDLELFHAWLEGLKK